jgi:CheY-like chemotaxis protein
MKESIDKTQILIVDDNVFNVQTLTILLQMKYKIKSSYAMEGNRAVQMVQEHIETCKNGESPYKLILMDCHMSDMDGYECTYKIIQACIDANVKLPYIVALTAFDSDDVQEKCKVVGMREFIVKPINANQI